VEKFTVKRVQKYDSVLTKVQHGEKNFSLAWLAFQRI
jgi:hypothetical protein